MKAFFFIIPLIFVFGCSKDSPSPDDMFTIEYHIQGTDPEARLSVKKYISDDLTDNVLLSSKDGLIYTGEAPGKFQFYAEYRTDGEISDDFRFWMTHKGKVIHEQTKKDAIQKDGYKIIGLSGIVLDKIN